jgi:hypothetical protein
MNELQFPQIDGIESTTQEAPIDVGMVQLACVGELCTTDTKGNRVSFERSVAFASKDARVQLSASVYGKQCDNGVYGPLLRDALAANVLGKQTTEVVQAMLAAGGRNPSKALAASAASIIAAAWADKTPKGQKAFYVGMVRKVASALANA